MTKFSIKNIIIIILSIILSGNLASEELILPKPAPNIKKLAKEEKIDADLVVPVPDSGNAAALGYAQQKKINFAIKNQRNRFSTCTTSYIKLWVRPREICYFDSWP